MNTAFLVDWIKCSDRLPNENDININNSDIFWVYLIDLYGNREVLALTFNIYSYKWECLPGEHISHWAYFKTPEVPYD